MIRMKNPTENMLTEPIEIDLDGPKGNAWELMAITSDVARFYGYTKHEREDLRLKMMSSGGYESLIATMEIEFPGHFDIQTSDKGLLERIYEAYRKIGEENA